MDFDSTDIQTFALQQNMAALDFIWVFLQLGEGKNAIFSVQTVQDSFLAVDQKFYNVSKDHPSKD